MYGEFIEGRQRLDYLLAENLRIIQKPLRLLFSLDAVLLAKFAYVPIRSGKIVDLCAGNGEFRYFLAPGRKPILSRLSSRKRLAEIWRKEVLATMIWMSGLIS